MKLSKTRVETLPIPATGQSFYWDDELRGFGVRVTPSGARSYIVQGRVKDTGKERRVTLGAHGRLTCDEARRKARAALVALDDGVDPQVEKKLAAAAAVTLHEVANDYCKNRRTPKGGALSENSVKTIQYHIKKNFADWADKPILSITSDMCSTRFLEISKRSEAQANQAFVLLRALINYSSDDENPRPNPVRILSKKKLWNPNRRKRGFIPLEKIGAVWNLLQERRTSPALLPSGQAGADIITFITLTGCRWCEAAELTWDCVNLDKASWHIADPKNHNPVTFPLSAPARALLAARPRGTDYVFPARTNGGHVKGARPTMKEVSKLAGLHLTPHDLRRTFIAIGIKLKIEMWKLKLLTNHVAKGDITIDHYTETSDLTYMAGELEQIAAYIVEQGAIAAGKNVVPLRGIA
ncbi:MAG: integrase family protein [Gallionellaceae bacterium]